MRSALHDVLPPVVRRSLVKFGEDLARARRRRRLTVVMMSERTGVGPSTYSRLERGDPSVAMGAYAMAMFVLGLGATFNDVADVRRDEVGLQLLEEQLPKRVRTKQLPTPL